MSSAPTRVILRSIIPVTATLPGCHEAEEQTKEDSVESVASGIIDRKPVSPNPGARGS